MSQCAYLLELACQSQNIKNIQVGRIAILSLSREWAVREIEIFAEPLIRLEDEWEYRHLGELYEKLDVGLLRRLVARGLVSRNPAIRETAHELLEWVSPKIETDSP